MPQPITDYIITRHAAFEMRRRQVTAVEIERVLAAPEQRFEDRPGREVLQARTRIGAASKVYLIRVFVDTDRRPAEIVTAYRTSKVVKYWKEE